jgi:hypothetical protein
MILGKLSRRLGPTAVPAGAAAVLDVQRLLAACTSTERLTQAGTPYFMFYSWFEVQ